ncbi:MAG: PAS domain S-box protein [Syntrophaceae bacterium]|nr:PAS domain S-box protein [Syntrophaceae bacterium]
MKKRKGITKESEERYRRETIGHRQRKASPVKSGQTVSRLSQENAVMAEIGRIISSTLNIEEVYERFAEEVRKLIPFDRIVINTINVEKGTVMNLYMAGKGVTGRKVGEVYPLEGSGNAEMVRTRSTILIQTEDFSEYKDRFPMLLSTFQAGFRSIMNVPLFSKGQLIGGLLLRSYKPYAYTEKDVRLAERVSSQIAGAIANALLFAERERAEEALRRSEERYRTILEEIQEGYFELDLSGNFTFVNDAECRILGYPTREELIGMNHRQCAGENSAKKLDQLFNDIYRTGEPVKGYDLELIKKDGTRVFSEISISLMKDSQGKPIGFRGTSRDVTERKRMEEALKKTDDDLRESIEELRATEEELRATNEELQAANKVLKETQDQLIRSEKLAAIGKLAGGVGHELRNPLGAIKNAVYYIKGKVTNSELARKEPRVLEFLEIIEDEINSSNKIISDLLNFSRVGKPAVSPAQIGKVMEDALSYLTFPEHIEVINKLEAGLPEVKIDRDQIRQVFVNILTNAMQAMPQGGKLTIDGRKGEKFLEVAISDTGDGISEDVIGKVFDPLFTTRAKGIGLGLAVCKSIMERHGGTIEVKSKLGEGAVFTVKLPLEAN